MEPVKERGAKWTLESITRLFEQRGLKLLDIGQQRVHGREKYRYFCRCGRENVTTADALQKNHEACPSCASQNHSKTCALRNEAIRQTKQENKRKFDSTAMAPLSPSSPSPPSDSKEAEVIVTSDVEIDRRKKRRVGPRWPDPKPQRADYAHLSKREWVNLSANYRASTPEYKAVKKVRYAETKEQTREKRNAYANAYAQTAARKRKMKYYRHRVKARRHALLQEISVEGHCAYQDLETQQFTCHVPAKDCDVDHIDPNTILADGKRRKQATFGAIKSLPEMEMEIRRNTAEDGTLLLQALCPHHHPQKTFRRKFGSVEERDRWHAVAAMKIEIGKCQFEECEFPDFVCANEDDSPSFHFDHLFSAQDENAPADMRKKQNISNMVGKLRKYSLDDIKTEISKCRLVHSICHRKISSLQRARGSLNPGLRRKKLNR